MEWLAILLSTASTRVLLNGEPGPPIWHRAGLRQGDPVAPQLFVLAVDTLGRLLRRAHSLDILQPLHPLRHIPAISLYADDVVIFSHPDTHDIRAIRRILDVFGKASGLCTNLAKCSASPIRCDEGHVAMITSEMACPISYFPVKYLGLPLSLRKPSTVDLLPLVDKLERKLSTWLGSMLSLGDRLALCRHVLCAMPIHILIAIAVNKSILARVNRIIWSFLWVGRKDARGGQCRVNWARVCRPTFLGGLGIRDLQRAGVALRTRWLWLQRTDASRPWSHLRLPHDPAASQIFRASTSWEVRDGRTCRFWTDPWIDGKAIPELAPLVFSLVSRRHRRDRTVAEGLPGRAWVRDIAGALGPAALIQYIELWRMLQNATLSAGPDVLRWKWTESGVYSAKSCYLALFHGSTTDASWKLTWKTWAPLRIKIFIWLALQDRCWTADRLARRGLPHNDSCVLCDQTTEDMHHLFTSCPFSRQIWHEVLSWCRSTATIPNPDTTFADWWMDACTSSPSALRKGLCSIIALTAWAIWRHRNGCVFDQRQPSIATLLQSIQEDARLWASAGANGLANLIPEI